MNKINIFEMNPTNLAQFQQMALETNSELPVVPFTEETARNMENIWKSIEATSSRWRGNNPARLIGKPTDRQQLWGLFAKGNPEVLPVLQDYIESMDSKKGKLAIDLGSGNSPSAKILLKRGWRVIAVDSSKSALDLLRSSTMKEINEEQLKIVESDIASFETSEQADLVIAADSLNYINPLDFKKTWQKIHDQFLKQGGDFIGSLYRCETSAGPVPLTNTFKEMGAWLLPDRRMVRPLLTNTGYDIKTCIYRKSNEEDEPICIQFVAKKL